jgi:hypothetical protein
MKQELGCEREGTSEIGGTACAKALRQYEAWHVGGAAKRPCGWSKRLREREGRERQGGNRVGFARLCKLLGSSHSGPKSSCGAWKPLTHAGPESWGRVRKVDKRQYRTVARGRVWGVPSSAISAIEVETAVSEQPWTQGSRKTPKIMHPPGGTWPQPGHLLCARDAQVLQAHSLQP